MASSINEAGSHWLGVDYIPPSLQSTTLGDLPLEHGHTEGCTLNTRRGYMGRKSTYAQEQIISKLPEVEILPGEVDAVESH